MTSVERLEMARQRRTDPSGPVLNTAVISTAAPTYAPPGRHHPIEPGLPLTGPAIQLVIQPP
jgi:hypothetical protein